MAETGDTGRPRVKRLLFLFLDGVGLGDPDPRTNPFSAARTPTLDGLLGGRLTSGMDEQAGDVITRRLDAALGFPGLPQSATGQATLLTGRNCARVMGGHYGPWPGPTLRRLLDEGTIFSEVADAGGSVRLANAYPPGYFDAISRGRARANVPVQAAHAAGLELADLAAYRRGEAVAADLTGQHFLSLDQDLPEYTAEAAGALLAGLAGGTDLTFFDYWISDRVGHRGSFDEAVHLVEALDRFMAGVIGALGETTLLVTSDHGNLEDKSTRGHTRAPVPLLSVGPDRNAFQGCASLLDVAPAIRRILTAAA